MLVYLSNFFTSALNNSLKPELVAGIGFEPMTFGL